MSEVLKREGGLLNTLLLNLKTSILMENMDIEETKKMGVVRP